jgi:capsular exopolysaccharide synthesis family protein
MELAKSFRYPRLALPEINRSGLGVGAGALERYSSMLTIAPVVGTQLVIVSFTTPDPILSARIANAHARAYVNWGLDLRRQASKSTQDFLRGQLVEIKQRVEQSEAALNGYRHSKSIVSFAIDDKDQIAEARMAALSEALTEAQTNRIRLEGDMQLVREGDYGSLPLVVSNPMIQVLRPQIDQLDSQYAAMSAHFTDRWPDLAKLKAQLDESRARLASEIATVTKAISREYEEAAARERALQQALDAEKERDLTRNDAAVQDAVLAREVETNRQLYEDVLRRMQEMGVAEQGPVSNVNIVTDAIAPRLPSEPKVLKSLSIAGLAGLIAGLTLAFALEHSDNRFKDVEEIERSLQLPRLAVAPDYAKFKPVVNRPQYPFTPSHPAGASARSPIMSIERLYSSNYIEPYRMIRVALLFSRAGGSPRSILFTSAIPQEGKTLTVCNTALMAARMGTRTLLVDADLRRPQCHRLFPGDAAIGLSDVLAGQSDSGQAAAGSPAPNLTLLCAGTSAPNPSALLVSSVMRDLLDRLSKQYDCVMIDSAPVLSASDTAALATMVDGVVLVVGQDTPRKAVVESYGRLVQAGGRVLGFVFNRVDFNRPQHRSHKQYYRYHTYYSEPAGRIDL